MADQPHIMNLPILFNARIGGTLGCPAGVEPALWHSALRNRIREHLAAVDGLLAVLDAIDGDCDLEDNGDDEPSLGGQCLMGPNGPETDLELDPLGRGEADFVGPFGRSGDADAEPSLGSPVQVPMHFVSGTGWVQRADFGVNQEMWAAGRDAGEREAFDGDAEPSIGYDTPEDSRTIEGGAPL